MCNSGVPANLLGGLYCGPGGGWGVGGRGVIILIMSQSSKCNVSQDICIAREKATFWYTLSRIHESEARKFKMNHTDDLLIFIYSFILNQSVKETLHAIQRGFFS